MYANENKTFLYEKFILKAAYNLDKYLVNGDKDLFNATCGIIDYMTLELDTYIQVWKYR